MVVNMSKEFNLGGDNYRVTGEFDQSLNADEVRKLRDNVGEIEGVNFSLDAEKGFFSADVFDSSKNPEQIVNEIRSRVAKTRHQGLQGLKPDSIDFSIEESGEEEISDSGVETEPVDGFWEKFQSYSSALTEMVQRRSNPDIEDPLSVYSDFLDSNSSTAGYVMENLNFDEEKFRFLLGNENFEEPRYSSLKDRYEDRINEAEEGSEYEEIWREILESHRANKVNRNSLENNIEFLTEQHVQLTDAGTNIQAGLEQIEEEGKIPVGWKEEGSRKQVVLPFSDSTASEEALRDQMLKELRRYSEGVSHTDNYTIVSVESEIEVVYESMQNASERLELELDYDLKEI